MRTAALYPIVIIGFMANNLIPARAGELVRAYIVGEREKVSKMAALGTIAVDRVFDGITLLPFLLIVGAFAGTNDELRFIAISMTVLFGAGLLVMIALALSEGFSRWVVRLALRLTPSRLKAQVEGLVESFLTGLHSFRSPGDMLAASVTSVVSWLLEATMYYMVGLAFNLDVGFHVYLLVTAGANLAIAVIATQGGVGPFEVVTQRDGRLLRRGERRRLRLRRGPARPAAHTGHRPGALLPLGDQPVVGRGAAGPGGGDGAG